MSTGIETVEVVEPWLYKRLSTDAQLQAQVADRVYGVLAPEAITERYALFHLQAARDSVGVGAVRILLDALYVAKIVAPASGWGPLTPGAKRIDALLHGAVGQPVVVGATTVGHISGVVRDSIIEYVEVEEGRQWRHLGGLYRIWAHAN